MSKIGKVLDIATQNCLLLAIGENGSAFVWGEFFDQKVSTITEFSNVCDTFKYNWPYIIHNPLIEKEKLNILKCLGVAFDDLVCFVFYLISAHCAYNFSHYKILNKRC